MAPVAKWPKRKVEQKEGSKALEKKQDEKRKKEGEERAEKERAMEQAGQTTCLLMVERYRKQSLDGMYRNPRNISQSAFGRPSSSTNLRNDACQRWRRRGA